MHDINIFGTFREVPAQCGENFPDTEVQLAFVKSGYMMRALVRR